MKLYLNSLIIGVSIIFTALIFANAFKNRNRSNEIISVTGLGKKDFVSDLIVWNGSFSKINSNLKEAYAALDKDRESIKNYLISKGIKESNIIFSAVNIDKEIDEVYDEDGNKTKTIFIGYRLKQDVQIESTEVDKVEGISREVSELINSGVEFYSKNPQYYYTKLSELKIEMIAEATKDANIRAMKIAENAGSDIGHLKNADLGVFQIVAQNSSEDFSWGGSYNTSSKRKTATITVKLDYETE
ncbi:SIMPL domain-containing protein [Sporocytophaga myxococcoides]|uniref:SIMPL domain-containing protein n=1 Tax=Sporocytophaga myxococcoides TaxID=153721 RepID=UPI00040F2B39|nr:SIMPL domain-containing protein [Sporocytophaga myxococcoides]